MYEHSSNHGLNSTTMLEQFAKTNVLLKNMDARIGNLVD
jgi:hypothetical protein